PIPHNSTLFPYTTLFRSLLFVFPIYWMATTALKTAPEVFAIPPVWWPANPQWHNLWDVLNPAGPNYSNFAFWSYAWHTTQITVRSEEHTSELQSPYDLVC